MKTHRPFRMLVTVLLAAASALLVAAADSANVSASLTPTGGHIAIDARTVAPPVPVFFTAAVQQHGVVAADNVTIDATVNIHVVQGRPEVLSLGVNGGGVVSEVTGEQVHDWSVRQGVGATAGQRFLDIRPKTPSGQDGPRDFVVRVRVRVDRLDVPRDTVMPIVSGGEAVASSWQGRFERSGDVEIAVVRADGVATLRATDDEASSYEFVGRGEPVITLRVVRHGAAGADAELTQLQVTGQADETAATVNFRLTGQARVERVGTRLPLLCGQAAPSGLSSGDGWHLETAPKNNGYVIVFERKGAVAFAFDFAAAIRTDGDWRRLAFQLLGGNVVSLTLTGLGDAVEFDPEQPVVMTAAGASWTGWLPADGVAVVGWKPKVEKGDAALSFSSAEETEIRIAAGLLRQVAQIRFHVMQGRLTTVRLHVEGPGEVVGVDGANVVGWQLLPQEKSRVIEVRFGRPIENDGEIEVRSQSVLGEFPVRAEPLRLIAEGGVRHAGHVRVANAGAVRLEIADADGVMQLAPEQFPGGPVEAGARQVFVYRFPAAERRFVILANRITPEVGVSQVVTYELGETDRVIQADIELDVREAALRDWPVSLPAGYAVIAVRGADVADYNVEAGAGDARTLRITFARQVTGRQLLQLRLERNQPAAAGEWTLDALRFPMAKSVRGYVGVVATPGFRAVPASAGQLAEVPLSLFPRQTAGLQQAFRIRDAAWTAAVRIEALGQSIHADVFHLYSVKQAAVSASVLINYFVVGAPASEFRIELPPTAGNVDVTGQGVRRDWRREGNGVVVSLHHPVLGAATLLLTFEEPLGARGGAIRPGVVRPLGVQAERGYVQVVSNLQIQAQVAKAEGSLLKLEPLELPAELRLFATAPALATFQYTTRPFALDLAVSAYQPGETVDQVIDFAQFRSQVARDGQIVTEARLFVKTRGRKMLRFQVPAGAKLWEARVDNELVTARADGDWTLLPLTARLNPNEPVSVVLRLGQTAGKTWGATVLSAPKMTMPMVVGEWSVRADRERLLVARGGSVEMAAPNLTESGFEWIATHGTVATVVLLLAIGLAALLSRVGTPLATVAVVIAAVGAVGLALVQSFDALIERRVNRQEIVYAATVVPAEGEMSVRFTNAPAWQAMLSPTGVGFVLLGAVACGTALRRQLRGTAGARWIGGGGFAAILGGVLAQHGGAAPFFVGVAVLVLWLLIWPGVRLLWESWSRRRAKSDDDGSLPASGAVVAIALVLGGSLLMPHDVTAMEMPTVRPPAQSIVQRWEIKEHRLRGEIEVSVRGTPGESFTLLRTPAILTGFTGDGLRVSKAEEDGKVVYYVSPERVGMCTGRASFELAVPDLDDGLPLLTGRATVQRVTVLLDRPGWEFGSTCAVQVSPTKGLDALHSGATLVLRADADADTEIEFSPRHRDVAAEETRFMVDAANLFVPGPGVVNGTTRLTIRPVQGKVTGLAIRVPEGFSIGDVANGPIGRWRFEPEKRLLHVAIAPAQATTFRFTIEMQRPAAPLPYEAALEPVRVLNSAGEAGSLGLAAGIDAQPEQLRPAGLSVMSVDDFDAELLPRDKDQHPTVALHAAYRYSGDAAKLALRAVAVTPEVRVAVRQLLSLGDDRLVLAADLNVAIIRVGLFQLSFALPPGLDLESASGNALSHWTEAADGERRLVTLHLKSRTLGQQAIALTLSGAAPAADKPWRVPQIRLREATRQTGELQVVPERGIRLRTIERANVSELDPRTIGNSQPGSLAFRLLDENAALSLGIETLDPWVTVQALQEVSIREGQTITRLALRYHIENAAVRQLRVGLPGLTEEQARTVRATGAAVSDLVAVPGSPGVWLVRLQRGIIGDTMVQIEFQGPTSSDAPRQSIAMPLFEGARQVEQFVAVRAGGRLTVDAAELPRGWQRVDWSAVPANLQDRADRSVPALAFRVAEAEKPLVVGVRRHAVADALKLRVTAADLMTIFSPRGTTLTAVELRIAVAEKSTLRVRLPDGATLFNTFMNGESVPVVREGDGYLFHVTGNTAADPLARVRLVYTTRQAPERAISLVGPRLSVPLENVSWRVVLPPGYALASYSGGLRLEQEHRTGGFDLADYEASLASRRAADVKIATDYLQTANSLLQQGQQQQAGEVLMRAAKTSSLDEATNEDARVQLRTLRTQQAIVGLNTRRQRLYLDSSAEAVRNEQLEQAANVNPLMQGKENFDPRQLEQLLSGNTVEENTALRGIAGRIVDQQLAAEPTSGAIDVTLSPRGRVLAFSRRLQVNGDAPLELRVKVERESGNHPVFGALVLGTLGVLVAFSRRRPAAV